MSISGVLDKPQVENDQRKKPKQTRQYNSTSPDHADKNQSLGNNEATR